MRVADLFCGAGGSSEGVRQSVNADVVLGIDWDAKALETYRKNHAHDARLMDLSDTEASAALIREYCVDAIIGSPPCQDFSAAGNRVQGERAALTAHFARIVCAVRPAYFVMENVPEVLSSEDCHAAAREWLAHGYHFASTIITASRLGVPQRRRRAFVIGSLGPLDELKFFVEEVRLLQQNAETSVFDALLGVGETYVLPPRGPGPYVLDSHKPAPTLRCNCLYSGSGLKSHPHDAGSYKTATKLSAMQAGVLMGFPPSYTWPDARGAASKQIGNAVCPPVMRWLMDRSVFSRATRAEEETSTHVHEHLCATHDYSGSSRSLALLGIPHTRELPPPDVLEEAAARIPGAWVHRHTPTLVVRYRVGGDADADSRVASIVNATLPDGWVLEVRQRGVQNFRGDDLYFFVPHEDGRLRRFRSKAKLADAGHAV